MFEGAAVVMGVSSCGKSTIGMAIAKQLGSHFIEGDKLHPKANVEKMSAGVPLTDDDRWPWLKQVGESLHGPGGCVASCSALKRVYREHISHCAGRRVAFVFLDGSRELLERRINARQGHFMPPSLLTSQLAALERPADDEFARTFDIGQSIDEIVTQATAWLSQSEGLAS